MMIPLPGMPQSKSVDFESSNLPIIVIDTNGQKIRDEPRIAAHMGIVNNPEGARNHVTDIYNDYDGRINIEIRGQSSQMYPKKSYGFETQDEYGDNLNVSMLGMPEENDWILYGPYSDKTLIRNALAFHLARSMGGYASNTRFCELVINDEYRGIYLFMEKIKRDKNRVDIATLTPADTTGDECTGGYIIKVDKTDDEQSPGWFSIEPPYSGWARFFFQCHDPAPDEIVPSQEIYIQNLIQEFETVLISDHFNDPVAGYARYIDANTFIDHFILREFSKEIDSYKYSTFMYKDKDSKDGRLKMGPFWDFNLGFGNVNFGHERAMYIDGWMYNTGHPHMYWWYRLMEDENFQNKLKYRWTELRRGSFHLDSIITFIDETTGYLEEARERNFERWPVIGVWVWPNFYVGSSYTDEVNYLKQWVTDRLLWMDHYMPGAYDTGVVFVEEAANPQAGCRIYPNPFSSSTTISYRLFESARIYVIIYNILGQKVKTLVDAFRVRGTHRAQWDGRDDYGCSVSNGLYVYVVYIHDRAAYRGKMLRHNF
jgi:hypothetical protein